MKYDIMLSIVVATYNHAPYIEQAIDGILCQKVDFSYEVLIGEDCSDDNSREILRQLEESLPENFTIFYRDCNLGMRDNFYDLFRRTRGKYIIVLESDDFWTYEYKLQRQVDFLENNPEYIAVAHNVLIADETGKDMLLKYPECQKKVYSLKMFADNVLPGQTSSMLYYNFYIGSRFSVDIEWIKDYPGDQWITFVLAANGSIFCFQEKWSAYRYIPENGSSYSASIVGRDDYEFKKTKMSFYRLMNQYVMQNQLTEESKIVSNQLLLWEMFKDMLRKKPLGRKKDFIVCFMESMYKRKVFNYILFRIVRYPFFEMQLSKRKRIVGR